MNSPTADEPGLDFEYKPLEVHDVRWFWLKKPFSLKLVHQTDVQHRADLARFCDEDNKALEVDYRLRAEQIEKAWWEEQAELSAGPAKGPDAAPEDEAASTQWQDYMMAGCHDEDVGTSVRGGLWEVDLPKRRLKSSFWPDSQHRAVRATWFVDRGSGFAPLRETVADELETAFRSEIWNPTMRHVQQQRQGVAAARVELTTLHTKGQYALFISETEAYLCAGSTFGTLFSKKGAPPGYRLRRGYQPPAAGDKQQELNRQQEERDNYAARTPVDRLVLCVHGIGQAMQVSNIAQDAACIRALLQQLSQDALDEDQQQTGRIEVLPVQWRKHLALDVDKLCAALMPQGVRNLRSMLHATAVEVLLYLTPLHCQDMLDSLCAALNATYAKFLARHPYFKGGVTLLAHSLGSVLCYDILCNQPHLWDRLEVNVDQPAQPQPRQSGELSPLTEAELRAGSQAGARQQELPAIGQQDRETDGKLQHLLDENQWLKQQLASLQEQLHRQQSAGQGQRAPDPDCGGQLSPLVKIKPINFVVDNFITVGSPLGLFLALRRINPAAGRGLGTPAAAGLQMGGNITPDGLPLVKRMYNLYQPYDPVAYRIEPLVVAGAEGRRPLFVPYYRGGRRLHIGMAEMAEDIGSATSKVAQATSGAVVGSYSAMKFAAGYVSKAFTLGDKKGQQELTEDSPEDEASNATAAADVASKSSQTESAIWRLTDGRDRRHAGSTASGAPAAPAPGPSPSPAGGSPADSPSKQKQSAMATSERNHAAGRLDFVLQDAPMENALWQALKAHFCYWTSADTALFVLRAAYGMDVLQAVSPKPKKKAADPSKAQPALAAPSLHSTSQPVLHDADDPDASLEAQLDKRWSTG